MVVPGWRVDPLARFYFLPTAAARKRIERAHWLIPAALSPAACLIWPSSWAVRRTRRNSSLSSPVFPFGRPLFRCFSIPESLPRVPQKIQTSRLQGVFSVVH